MNGSSSDRFVKATPAAAGADNKEVPVFSSRRGATTDRGVAGEHPNANKDRGEQINNKPKFLCMRILIEHPGDRFDEAVWGRRFRRRCGGRCHNRGRARPL
ncbi:unnamed protein product [Sphagnum troendelagicum]|uniref:Uncharacterized protein n=1 Tax=Sphagnum troendelagicum TaxID=128251 RepID=A0ABP0UI69_9BRYO